MTSTEWDVSDILLHTQNGTRITRTQTPRKLRTMSKQNTNYLEFNRSKIKKKQQMMVFET